MSVATFMAYLPFIIIGLLCRDFCCCQCCDFSDRFAFGVIAFLSLLF